MEMIEDETAQVILIGGFLIAIGVVSAILMLNNISYSQTITSQNGDSGDFGPLEFADSTERAVSEAMTGNGTTPGNASTEFEEYLKSYSDRANEVVSEEGVSTKVPPPPSGEINEAWMVGQRRTGNFTNATGGNRWIMAEHIDPDEHLKAEFELNVSEMASTTGEFTLNATEDTNFNPPFDNGWNLTAKIDGSPEELSLNLTDFTGASPVEYSDSTVVSGNVTVNILNKTVDGSSSGFPDPGPGFDTREADGFRFEDASNGIGTYDFRFKGGFDRFVNSNGPCKHPDGPPNGACRSADGTEKHIVGVVHNITSNAVELDYVSRSTSYSKKIGGMVLDADDVNLNEIENVDGAASFNIEILADNSPEEESSGTLQIEYRVENTGTVNGTQDIELRIPGANSDIDNSTDVLVENNDFRVSTGPTLGGNVIENVTWQPDAGKNGTYTAYVYSQNSTTGERTEDAIQVSVDKSSPSGAPGIPDGPVGFALPSPVLETLAGVTQR